MAGRLLRHLPLAPQIPALPGKGQVPATKADPLGDPVSKLPPRIHITASLLSPSDVRDLRLPSTEAVTRFLMSCAECQKRMHFNSNGLEPKGRGAGGHALETWEAVQGRGSPQKGLPLLAGTGKCRDQQLS